MGEGTPDLRAELAARTRAGELVRPEDDGRLRCLACGHGCVLAEGEAGTCQVRFRRGDELRVPWGYVGALAVDPIEKKPFFHFLPGATSLTFGMLGCDFRCAFCQNWFVSQVLRDDAAEARGSDITPEELVDAAGARGAGVVASSFNEPFITAEWARDVFRVARDRGLATAFVSNGHATPEALEFMAPWLDAVKVDLKAFRPASYQGMGGNLEPVKATLRALAASPTWVEVVTVLIPEVNDSPEEVAEMAGFLAGLDPDLPWHLHGFHPDYRMTGRRATTWADLEPAAAAARAAGLRYVYPGLVPGLPAGSEDTACMGCGEVLIRRGGLRAREVRVGDGGACPGCGEILPGVYPAGGPVDV